MAKSIPIISIIIPHWNGIEILSECINSLQKTEFDSFEIIVCDNASTDGSQQWLKENHNHIVLVENQKNYGYAGGCNRGADIAKGEYLVFLNNDTIQQNKKFKCLIIDNYENNIEEELFYSVLNQSKQENTYILINSFKPIKKMNMKLKDLKSRAESFVDFGIELPTDDLLRVIISKSFSEKQIDINPKISDYIIKNIERSYEKVFKFIKEVDNLSLSSGKSININLIKKVLTNE